MLHKLHILQGRIREHGKRGDGLSHKLARLVTGEAKRSPHWRTIETRWKANHPDCAAGKVCKGKIQVHHIVPFKHNPSLELQDGTGIPPATGNPGDKANLISLCEGNNDAVHHHLHVGHGGNFRCGNLHVEQDAALLREHPELQEKVYAKALAERVES